MRKLRGDETAEEIFDVRVLGRGDFVQKFLGSDGELGHGRMRKVSQAIQVEISDLISGSQRDKVSMAWALVSYLAVREMGYSGVEVGRILNLSGPGITKSVEKGKRIISADESLRRKLIS